MTCLLLVSGPCMSQEEKISFLFNLYASNTTTHVSEHQLRRSLLKQLLDHIFFAVIYAIPNLAYHHERAGYYLGSDKCERVMTQKLQMQKKGLNDKQNIMKAICLHLSTANGGQTITFEEFRHAVLKFNLLNTSNLRKRLSTVVGRVNSKISKHIHHPFDKIVFRSKERALVKAYSRGGQPNLFPYGLFLAKGSKRFNYESAIQL